MHRFFAALLLLIVGSMSAPARAEPTVTTVSRRVQKFYDDTFTFRAKFTQTTRLKVQNVTKVATGVVSFARKGKLSFRYDKPKGDRVVSDGKKVRAYQREHKQLFSSKVKHSQYPAALAFLDGKGKLGRKFKLRLISKSSNAKHAELLKYGHVLEAIPKQATPAFSKLLFFVDPQSGEVIRVLIIDARGNLNRFDFSDAKRNKKIPPGEFRFVPPPGTHVIHP